MARESILTRTMVELADNLVENFDVVDLLTTLVDRCVDVLDVAAAGMMLAAADGELRVIAASSAAMRAVELFELQAHEGPCQDCYRTGDAVVNQDLARHGDRWPRFSPVALGAGYVAVDAVPMRLRGQVIGALNLFRKNTGSLNTDDILAARALADIATIAIIQHRAADEIRVVNERLSYALSSRIIIEQAKGMIAEREGIGIDEAFARLRNAARNRNERLADVARTLVDTGQGPTPDVWPRPPR